MPKKFKIIISTAVLALIILLASLIPLIQHQINNKNNQTPETKMALIDGGDRLPMSDIIPTEIDDNAKRPFSKVNLISPISDAINSKTNRIGFTDLEFSAPTKINVNLKTGISSTNVAGNLIINNIKHHFSIGVVYQYNPSKYYTMGLTLIRTNVPTNDAYEPFAMSNIIKPVQQALINKLGSDQNDTILNSIKIDDLDLSRIMFDMSTNRSSIAVLGNIVLADHLTYNFHLNLSYNFTSAITKRYSTSLLKVTYTPTKIIKNTKNPFSYDNLLTPIRNQINTNNNSGFTNLKFSAPTIININMKAKTSYANVVGNVDIDQLTYHFSMKVVYQYPLAQYQITQSKLSIAISRTSLPLDNAYEPFAIKNITKPVQAALSNKLGSDQNDTVLNSIKIDDLDLGRIMFDMSTKISSLSVSGSIVLDDHLTYNFTLVLSYNFNTKVVRRYSTTLPSLSCSMPWNTKDNAYDPFSQANLAKPINDALNAQLKKTPFSELSFKVLSFKKSDVNLIKHLTTRTVSGSIVIEKMTYHFSMTIVYHYSSPNASSYYDTSALNISYKWDSGDAIINNVKYPFSHDNLKAPIKKAITDKLSKGETFDNLLFNAPNQVDIILKSQQLAQAHITGSVDIDQVTYKLGLIVKYHYDSASYESNSLTMTAKIDGLTPWNPPISGIVDNAKYPFSHNNLDVPIRKALNDTFNSKSTAKISFTAPTITDITFPSAKSAYATIKGHLDIDTLTYQFSIKVTYQYDNECYLTDSLSINTGSVIDNAMQPIEPVQEIFTLTTVKAPVEAAIQKHFPNGYSNINIAKNAQGGLAFDKVSQSENNNISAITVSGTVIDSQNKKVNNFTVKISYNFSGQAYHHNLAKFWASADSLTPANDIFSRATIDNMVRLLMAKSYRQNEKNVTINDNLAHFSTKPTLSKNAKNENLATIRIDGNVQVYINNHRSLIGQAFYQCSLTYNFTTHVYNIGGNIQKIG